jgi:hypothetical protein
LSSLSERNARILFLGVAVLELAETASALPAGAFVQPAEMISVAAIRNKTEAFMSFTAASFRFEQFLPDGTAWSAKPCARLAQSESSRRKLLSTRFQINS